VDSLQCIRALKKTPVNVQAVLNIVENPDFIYIVTHFHEAGNLTHVFKELNDLNFDTKWDFMRQIARGLSFLHQKGIPHGDIKPSNILASSDNYIIQLTDFGLSYCIDPFEITIRNSSDSSTRMYRPPQFWMQNSLPTFGEQLAADIFSLGLLYLAILQKSSIVFPLSCCRLVPHADDCRATECYQFIGETMYQRYLGNREPLCVVRLGHQDSDDVKCLKLLLQKMTLFDPKDRPTIETVLNTLESFSASAWRRISGSVLKVAPRIVDGLLCVTQNPTYDCGDIKLHWFAQDYRSEISKTVPCCRTTTTKQNVTWHDVTSLSVNGIEKAILLCSLKNSLWLMHQQKVPKELPVDKEFKSRALCTGPGTSVMILGQQRRYWTVYTLERDDCLGWTVKVTFTINQMSQVTEYSRYSPKTIAYHEKKDAILFICTIGVVQMVCRKTGFILWRWQLNDLLSGNPSSVHFTKAISKSGRIFLTDGIDIFEADSTSGKLECKNPFWTIERMNGSGFIKDLIFPDGEESKLLVSASTKKKYRRSNARHHKSCALYVVNVPPLQKTLREICRNVILQQIRFGEVHNLNLPKVLLDYLQFKNSF